MFRLLSAATIFLAAFLLFQIQPIMARFVLPRYGGSAAVWGVCILFYQSLLFLGYLYADLLSRLAGASTQARVHLGLLALSVLSLPIAPDVAARLVGDTNPVLEILVLLTSCIGLPYFLLSSTSPLVQSWLVRSSPRSLPYRFYALSNLASLGGLLAYPLVVERLWALPVQSSIWSAGYFAYALFGGMLAWRSRASPDVASTRIEKTERSQVRAEWSVQVAWVLLAALPSALSLAVTNHLTQNVAAIPFLWIVPLAIYLLTLILCFDGDGWYRRAVFRAGNMIALGIAGFLLIRQDLNTNLLVQLPVFSLLLFTVCMTLHGELVARKPDGEGLTRFYLLMAFGGAVGGVSIGLGAPFLLRGYYELPLTLSACALALLLLDFRRSLLLDLMLGGMAVWICATTFGFIGSTEAEAIAAGRNFYGGLRVIERKAKGQVAAHRDLVHGAIVHGSQFLDEARRREPTAYYARGSGADLALENFRRSEGRVGVIGLGTGAMAAYGRSGETYRYYELNPMVVEYARKYFTYLDDSAARIETVVGDGRLSLEQEVPQAFDVLAVDAFSGDSIPVHLLSMEAFELYVRHLRPDGVLAIHISNAVLDLRPVVTAAAAAMGRAALEVTVGPDEPALRGESTWMLVADQAQFDARPGLRAAGSFVPAAPGFAVWTDGYSNLLGVLR